MACTLRSVRFAADVGAVDEVGWGAQFVVAAGFADVVELWEVGEGPKGH